MKDFSIYSLVILLMLALNSSGQQWETHFELSGGNSTPDYESTVEYCQRLASHSPSLHYSTFGISPQGRPLPLLVANVDGHFDPSWSKDNDHMVVMVQACIHSGESDGKDAMLMLLRDVFVEGKWKGVMENITLLFIPVFNVDGHERRGPYNRINQNGPQEMGWRTNAMNLNLNRDYLKADAPEMRAWLKLFNEWMPDFFIDCHTTDGADYQYEITYEMEIHGNMDEDMTRWQTEGFIPSIEKRMADQGKPIFPYVSFRNWFDPTSGIVRSAAPPMLSHGYTALRNRPSLLLETHMLKPYKTRVEATYEMVLQTLLLLKEESNTLRRLIQYADQVVTKGDLLKQPFPVKFRTDFSDSSFIPFKGIGYTVETSDLTRGRWFRYGNEPVTMNMKVFNKVDPAREVMLPAAYVIPPQWMEVRERLQSHGVIMYLLAEETEIGIESYRFSNYQWNRTPYEGRIRMGFETSPIREARPFPKGSWIVPMNQQTAKIIAYMLEPEAEGSLVQWGFFNSIFEQKEYAESYVMEKLARAMLENDPELRSEFEERKKNDQAYASSPWMMLNWFYSKTPWWDVQKDIYPIGRIMDTATLKQLKYSNP